MRAPAIGLATTLLCLAGSARATPLDAFGMGSRGTAMGGAQAADVADFSANYYNPAGLARAQGVELSLGYMRADQFLYVNGSNSGVDPVKGLVGGVVVPGRLFRVPFAFGAALFLPDDFLSRVVALPQDQPRWELYDNRNQLLYVAANLAVSPFSWLQIGGGISFMAATSGSLAISGSAAVLQPAGSELRHEVDADLTAIRYPQVGARIELSKHVALALVYRGQFSQELDLHAILSGGITLLPMGKLLTTAYYDLVTDSVSAFQPQQGVLGTSWEVTPDVRVNVDLTYVNWSAYVPPVAALDVKLNIPPRRSAGPSGSRRRRPRARRPSSRSTCTTPWCRTSASSSASPTRPGGKGSCAAATSTTGARSRSRPVRRTTSIATGTCSPSGSACVSFISRPCCRATCASTVTPS